MFQRGAVAYAAIGSGVGACGTSLLALLAARVPEGRRAAAAAAVWGVGVAGLAVACTRPLGRTLHLRPLQLARRPWPSL